MGAFGGGEGGRERTWMKEPNCCDSACPRIEKPSKQGTTTNAFGPGFRVFERVFKQ